MVGSRRAVVLVFGGVLVVLMSVGAAFGLGIVPTPHQGPPPLKPLPPQPTPEDALKQAVITGYADRFSVQPGQTVRFSVSSEAPQYHANIVRIFHADPDPRGPGLKEVPIASSITGDYKGVHQALPLGSYVSVPGNRGLNLSRSFTITVFIAPTTIPGSKWNDLADRQTPALTHAPQGIVTKLSPKNAGYGLFIGEDGSPALWLGDGNRVEKLSSGVALRPWAPARLDEVGLTDKLPGDPNPQMVNTTSSWYFVSASYDAATGKVIFFQDPLNHIPDATRQSVQRTAATRQISTDTAPLLIGAGGTQPTTAPVYPYNGKIDNPRVYDRVLGADALRSIEANSGPSDAVGDWDFSRGISSHTVIDPANPALDGRTVNLPARAVEGHNWNAHESDFRLVPQQYGAIYFHQDDLSDARWKTAFHYTVPPDTESGIYAAKLTAGEKTFYIPFFVRPSHPTARIALVMSTNTYIAYGQTGVPNLVGPSSLALYSRHADGSGTMYSTRLRPITSEQPGGAPRHFVADTFLADWLHVKGFKVDILTDEDVTREGAAALRPYKVVLTSSHPEYTTGPEYDAFDSYLHGGGRVMYLGGDGFYWVTGSGDGGRYLEIRRFRGTETWEAAPGETHLSTTGEEGGLWRFRGRPPQQTVAVGFDAQGYGSPHGAATTGRPYDRMPDSFNPEAAFIFRGIGPNEVIGNLPNLAAQSPGAAGDEIDRVDYAIGSPADTLIVATASGFPDTYQHVNEEVLQSDSFEGGSVNPLVRADMAYSKLLNGGAVFTTGSITWDGVLSQNNYNNNVSQITENVLRQFASDTPLP